MNKEQYLQKKSNDLSYLLDERRQLKNFSSQIFAKKIGSEFEKTYNEDYLWRYAIYLSSTSAFLLEESHDSELATEACKFAAEIYENLYYTSEKYDKEYSLVLSSLCYDIAGYQANSQCLINELENKGYYSLENQEESILVLWENKILKTVQLFLQKKIFSLLDEIEDFEIDPVDEISYRYREAFQYYKEAMESLCIFILNGEPGNYREHLEKSHTEMIQCGNVLLSNIIGLLNTRLMMFDYRNIWDSLKEQGKLPDPTWNNYLKLLSRDIYGLDKIKSKNERKSIFEFWQSQLKALKSNIIKNEKNYVLQMPTSAGKTLIAEIMIINSLLGNRSSRCIYIAPFRALVTEIEETLSERLGKLGFVVSNAKGQYEMDEFQSFLIRNADVLIATPEKIDLLYRRDPEFFENVSLVVIDEGHMIGNENSRSSLLEFLIIKLRRKLIQSRFLFISAVMTNENAEQLSEWLSGEKNNLISSPQVFGKEWEPTTKLIGYFSWYPQENSGHIVYPYKKLGKKTAFLPYIIKENSYTCLNPDSSRQNTRRFPKNTNGKYQKNQTAIELAYRFINQGSILIFTPNPKLAIDTGKAFLKLMKYRTRADKTIKSEFNIIRTSESIEMATKWLGIDHTITKCLRRGVGIHYGPLSEPVRKAIENDFRKNIIKMLISTNTIGQGLNFPIKTAIIHSLDINRSTGTKISVRDFWNIIGRSGRAGKETEGQIIFLNFNYRDLQLFEEYTNKNNIENINSKLFIILKELIDERISESEFNEELTHFAEPSLLNILMEESVDTIDEEYINDLLGFSLFKVQAIQENYDIEPMIRGISKINKKINSEVQDRKLRGIYSKSGFYLSSCLKMSTYIEDNLEVITDIIMNNDYESLLCICIGFFSDISEMNDEKIDKSLLDEYGEELYLFTKSWVNRTPISELKELWDEHFYDTGLEEKMEIYINQMLEFRYPWGVSVFLLISIYHLNKQYRGVPKNLNQLPKDIRSLPSFIKYGLNDISSCMAKSIGFNTRESSIEIASKCVGIEEFSEFIEWLKDLDVQEIRSLNLSEFEIMNILHIIQKLSVNNTKIERIECEVRGIYYRSVRRELSKRIDIGDRLSLKRDLDNIYDIYAIKVFFKNRELGFIPRNMSQMLSVKMDLDDRRFSAIVIDKIKKDGYYSLILEIHELNETRAD